MVALDRLLAAVGSFDLDLAWLRDAASAEDVVDLVLLEQELDAAGEPVGDRATAPDDLLPVVVEIVELEPELVCLVLHELVELGVAQQGFGRDAAPVEAGAAGAFHLDAGDFFPELGSADRADVAGWTTTDDNQIVFAHEEGGRAER